MLLDRFSDGIVHINDNSLLLDKLKQDINTTPYAPPLLRGICGVVPHKR